MKLETDIILPMSGANSMLRYMNSVALRTLRASTGARIHVMGNTTPDERWRLDMEMEAKLCKANYRYYNGYYSNSRFWNWGLQHCTGKYYAVCNADCIYFPGWIDNITQLMEREKEWWCVWPRSLHATGMGLAYPTEIRYENRIQETHHPAIAAVFRRDDPMIWDEELSMWEMDRTIMEYAKANNKKMGVCLNSRVDHFNCSYHSCLNFEEHFGESFGEHCDKAKRYAETKWGPT